MNIVVCVSHVPDTATKIKINQDRTSIDPAGVTFVINPYDEIAVEEALKSKEKFGGVVTAISYGSEASKESIRKSLAMGVDKGILIKGNINVDSLTVAEALAGEIKNLNPDVIFCGKQSVDYDSSAVGQMIAELLGYPSISTVVKLDISENEVTAEREIEGGKEVVKSKLPLVITTQKGLNDPRYASLKGIMGAKSKVIEEKTFEGDSNRLHVHDMKMPEGRRKGKIVGNDASAVPELVKLLREEAKVI
ncbi:MAG: electron transfer flavoprotein subunit beta/FixA family protein [Bacteroidetes bacterium]|nr:electron transfer flavoprotein subunit beta/FixA family protein [Bacteroidota bacterium]MBU2585470.1 electron transfer flavoprotein subunit beta/FixA family protein [Bacteroidota bacterium]